MILENLRRLILDSAAGLSRLERMKLIVEYGEIRRAVDDLSLNRLDRMRAIVRANEIRALLLGEKAGEVESESVEQGPFGPVFRQFYHDAQGAIAHLKQAQTGEAVAALHHPEVGDINLVWGKEGTAEKEYEDGYGLAKIAIKHSEVLDDLQGLVNTLHEDKPKSTDAYKVLVSDTHKAIVRMDWDRKAKTWLLTTYTRDEDAANSGTRADAARLNEAARASVDGKESLAPDAPDGKGATANKKHAVNRRDVLTPGGALAAEARNSRADTSPWYYQGDIGQLAFTANVTIGGQPDPRADFARDMLAKLKAAQAQGWSRISVRAGSLGTVWMLEKNKQFLTRAGFDNLTNAVFSRPDMPEPGSGFTNLLESQSALARGFQAWLDTLPEDQRQNRAVVVRKMAETPIGQWARLQDNGNGEPVLSYLDEDRKEGIRITQPDFPSLLAEVARLARGDLSRYEQNALAIERAETEARTNAVTLKYARVDTIDTPLQGQLASDRKHISDFKAKIKALKAALKETPVNGGRDRIRLDLLKAESGLRLAQDSFARTRNAIEERANELGLTTVKPATALDSVPGRAAFGGPVNLAALIAITDALEQASLALSASHNLTVTDRPDLPRDQWPVWMIDNAEALEAIETARRALGMDDEDGVRVSVIEDILD